MNLVECQALSRRILEYRDIAMDLINTRKTSIIYTTLLVIAMLFAMPGMDVHAQSADINKPTRERVKSKKAEPDKKEAKQEATPSKKQETAPVKKQEIAPAKGQDDKSGNKQDIKTAAGKEGAKTTSDTVTKTEAPKPKERKTVNTATADFDGIDVSRYQGYINWAELKKNPKINFVYIKATEGSDLIDPLYQENIRNARKQGFKVGSYHFLTTSSSMVRQFMNFAKVVKRDEQDLLPVIDVERIKPWSAQQLRDSLKVFADMVEDYYGCKPVIYAGENFFNKYLGRAFAGYPLFIARYNTVPPNVNTKWVLWQFADNGLFKGAVKGNHGEVDLSRFNKGCGVSDIAYKPAKGKPRISVMDAVDKNKEKPSNIKLTEQGKPKDVQKSAAKQKEEEQKKAERAKKENERDKRLAEEEAKNKAKEKAEADKKAKAQAERDKREKARQQAKDQKAKEEAAAKQRKAAEQKARADAEAKRKAEAEAKAKRKAAAQQAKQDKAKQQSSAKQNKTASLLGSSTTSSKMSQAQQGDSIRSARYKGRKINKSSADND